MDKFEKQKKFISPVLGKYFTDFEIDHAKGCYLFGTDGKRYLDFSSGIAVCSTGHSHPHVVNTVRKQVNKLIHICIGIAYYAPYLQLAEKLSKIVPVDNPQFFFCQSGSEAVEAAIKLAKYSTKKPGLIALRGAFHGRTLGALSLTTSKLKYRDGYAPLLPEVYISEPNLKSIERLLKTHAVAGVIVEPILGEGGYIMLPPVFLKGLRRLCSKYNALLIFDEVQTGIGRTGKWFAADHLRIKPDVICMSKGIASGFPLGGIAASSRIMKLWSPGAHGSTFGGNPVSCAAAIATLEVIQKEHLLQNASFLGVYLKGKLLRLMEKFPIIKDVRGLGLMIGVDFKDSAAVKAIMNFCLQKGLVLISTGGDGTAIRFVPPLTVNKKQIDQALKIFAAALENA